MNLAICSPQGGLAIILSAHLIGICLSYASGVALTASAAGQERDVQDFRGVTPGTTTEAELRANQAWGQPLAVAQPPQPEGRRRLVYNLQPWEQVAVMIEGGVVRTIDFVPPAVYLDLDAFVNALKLGPLRPLAALPAGAEAGGPPEPGWGLLEPSDVYIVLCVEQVGDRQHVKWMRTYGAAPSKGTRPDPPVVPPPPAPVPDAPPAAADAENARRAAIVKAVVAIVERHHVSAHPVDDEIARRTVERLMNWFGANTYYFTQSDVDRFGRRGLTLVDELRQGDYRLGQEVQDTYVQRVRQRAELVREFLELEHDFTVDERLPRADAAQYAKSEEEVRELWRNRVKFWMLRHRASGADELEAQRRIMSWMPGLVNQVEHWGPDDALNALLNSLLQSFDPRSQYLPPVALEDHQIQVRGELSGIGAAMEVKDGYITVARMIPNSPAARGGQLKVGDRILAVGEGEEGEMVNVVGTPLRDVVELIRGQRGTVVRLQVLPAAGFESSIYRITRDRIELTNVAGTVLADGILPEGCEGRVGYVHVPRFYLDRTAKSEGREDYRSSTRDLEKILQDFAAKHVDVVVLDVRENGGGPFDELVEMAGLFLEGGAVVQVKDRSGNVQVYSPRSTSIAWRGPLVVLTSQFSGGATELFVGAMADYHRGLIIGDPRTYGGGTSAGHVPVKPVAFPGPDPPDLGSVLVTYQKLYRPSGESVQLRGVTPHLVLPWLTAVTVPGEESLPHALAHDTIAPATFLPYASPLAPDLLEALRAASEARRRDSPYFTQLADAIEQEKTRRERTHDSLKEADVLAEGGRPMPEEDWPAVPGVPAVKLTPYLEEVLAIALELPAPDALPPRAVAPFTAKQARAHQEAWAKYLGQPIEMTNSIGMKLTLIPPGEFQMGSAVSAAELHQRFEGAKMFDNEHPRHPVRIGRPYYLGTHEVTLGQFGSFVTATDYQTTAEKEGRAWGYQDGRWNEIVGRNWRNPGYAQDSMHPVTCVSWNDAVAFCQWLSHEEVRTYRLPTEAEWEYACRAGTDTLFFWGDDPDAGEGYLNAADKTGTPDGRSWSYTFNFGDGYAATSPVGRFKPNAFGLQDMLGNVWEWCSDWYASGYYAESPVGDPAGPASGSSRVQRGGAWINCAGRCRPTHRTHAAPGYRGDSLGFRLASSPVD